jgi:acetyltransferase-like isoleucine patch superfamily enzyme
MTQEDKYRFDRLVTSKDRGFLRKYQDTIIGSRSLGRLIAYELVTTFINPLQGALGLAARKVLFPGLFGQVGKGVVFGHHMSLLSPHRIFIGDNTLIDDFVVLSHRGTGGLRITIGNNCLIARATKIYTRGGNVEIGNHANISASCHIVSANRVIIGDHCLIAANCYIGGLQHHYADPDKLIIDQGVDDRGGVVLGRDVWLGAHVIVNDGVEIGDGAIVGAGSVVTRNIPPYSIAVGVPAKVVRERKHMDTAQER